MPPDVGDRDAVVVTAFEKWWAEDRLYARREAMSDLVGAFPAIASIDPVTTTGTRLMDHLLRKAGVDIEERDIIDVTDAISAMGRAAVKPEVLNQLRRMLDDHRRGGAAQVIGAIGPSAARADIVATLLAALEDEDEWDTAFQIVALEALGATGAAGATQKAVKILIDLIEADDDNLADEAAEALSRARPKGLASGRAFDRLRALLEHGEPAFDGRPPGKRELAARVLGVGFAATRSRRVLDAFLDLTQGGPRDIAVALEGFRAMGPAGACDDVLDVLVPLVHQHQLARPAMSALGAMGEPAARPDVVAALLHRLCHSPESLHGTAAHTIGELGPLLVRPDVLGELLGLLINPASPARDSAAWALGLLGPAAAGADVVRALIDVLLGAGDGGLLYSCARSLGRMAPATANERVVNALFQAIERGQDDPRLHSVRAGGIRALGEIALHHPSERLLRSILSVEQRFVDEHREAQIALGNLQARGIRVIRNRAYNVLDLAASRLM